MAHRIVVVGVSGNGKTTLSRKLAAQLGVPYVELDALNHLPGWTRPPALAPRGRALARVPGT